MDNTNRIKLIDIFDRKELEEIYLNVQKEINKIMKEYGNSETAQDYFINRIRNKLIMKKTIELEDYVYLLSSSKEEMSLVFDKIIQNLKMHKKEYLNAKEELTQKDDDGHSIL